METNEPGCNANAMQMQCKCNSSTCLTHMDYARMVIDLERMARTFDVFYTKGVTPNEIGIRLAKQSAEEAKLLLSYCRHNDDWEVMKDCCRINRHIFYRYAAIGACNIQMQEINHALKKIETEALKRIWGIAEEDTSNYYISYADGQCRNIKTNEEVFPPDEDGSRLTGDLATPRARQAIAMAIDEGWIERTPTGYKWVWDDGKKIGGVARLAYFLELVYCEKPEQMFSRDLARRLGALFGGVKRLEVAVDRNKDTGKIQGVKHWKTRIQALVNKE